MGKNIVTVQPNADGFFTLIDTFKNNKPWDLKEACPVGGYLAFFKNGERKVVNYHS